MYICVDFDGTVVDHRYPDIGRPAPEAIEHLKDWVAKGAKIILFTMRSGEELAEAAQYLKKAGVELFGVNRNPTQDKWTESPKAYGQLYVDDAAFGCPLIQPIGFARPCVDWSIVGPQVAERLKGV
jgi:hypothetical protein